MGRSTAVAMSGSGNSRTSVRCPRLPETLLDPSGGDADTPRPFAGEVPERLKGLVSKTSVGLVLTVGSNPTLSASLASRDLRRGSRRFAARAAPAERRPASPDREVLPRVADAVRESLARTAVAATSRASRSLRSADRRMDIMDWMDWMDPNRQPLQAVMPAVQRNASRADHLRSPTSNSDDSHASRLNSSHSDRSIEKSRTSISGSRVSSSNSSASSSRSPSSSASASTPASDSSSTSSSDSSSSSSSISS